jgi:two-component sensor histidine kinase
LLISMQIDDKQLMVTIRDNGVGLAEAARLRTRSTESMGLQLTATRLAIFNQGKKGESHYKLQSIKDSNGHIAGAEAIIRINTRLSYD